MSTIQVINAKHPSSASNNIVLDNAGNATFAGTAAMASSFLRNRLINGDMRIDQRNAGASVTPGAATYTLDRWLVGEDTAGSLSVQQSSVVPSGQGFSNSLLVTVTSPSGALGSTQYVVVSQRVEGFNVSDFELGSATAKTFTLSFWVRSSVTGTYSVSLRNSADTRSYIATYSINAANTWEYKTLAVAGDTAGTWLVTNGTGLSVNWTLGVGSTYQGTAGSWQANLLAATSGSVNLAATNGATFYLTGVQLEVGTAATPFERRQYGQELSLCQRYFQRYDTPAGRGATNGSSGCGRVGFTFQVPMRTAPTLSFTGTLNWYDGTVTGTITSLQTVYTTSIAIEYDASFATGTSAANRPLVNFIGSGGTAVFNISAEL